MHVFVIDCPDITEYSLTSVRGVSATLEVS